MAIWSDIAAWVGPTPNTGSAIAAHRYVVIHIADGSYAGTIAWQRNPSADVSSHFIVAKDGRVAQMVDTAKRAWTQRDGNPYSISIENEGRAGESLTAKQIEANAQILARAHKVHGIPLQLTGKVGTPGLGHHSMGAESGADWGHSLCPGSPIKAQKPAILARAIQIVSGTTPASAPIQTPESTPLPKEPPVTFLAKDATAYYVCDGITSRPVPAAVDPAVNMVYLARTLGWAHGPTTGPGANEWTDGGWTRLGWSEAVCGKLPVAPAPVTLSDAQTDALGDRIATALAAAPDNPLGDADKPAIVAAVKQAIREGVAG